MNKYLTENLAKDEKVVLEAELNKMCFIPYIVNIVLGLILFIIGLSFDGLFSMLTPCFILISLTLIIVSGLQIVSLNNMCLVVTNKRVLGKVGFLSLATLDYPIVKVDNISLSAGVFGNLLKYYTISIQTAGTDARNRGLRFGGIKNAIEFKNLVVAAIEQHADDARKAQAEEIAKAMSGKQ